MQFLPALSTHNLHNRWWRGGRLGTSTGAVARGRAGPVGRIARRGRDGQGHLFVRPHYQRLKLGYIADRGSVVSPLLSRVGLRLTTALGLADREVPYWIGQTFVAARARN